MEGLDTVLGGGSGATVCGETFGAASWIEPETDWETALGGPAGWGHLISSEGVTPPWASIVPAPDGGAALVASTKGREGATRCIESLTPVPDGVWVGAARTVSDDGIGRGTEGRGAGYREICGLNTLCVPVPSI